MKLEKPTFTIIFYIIIENVNQMTIFTHPKDIHPYGHSHIFLIFTLAEVWKKTFTLCKYTEMSGCGNVTGPKGKV